MNMACFIGCICLLKVPCLLIEVRLSPAQEKIDAKKHIAPEGWDFEGARACFEQPDYTNASPSSPVLDVLAPRAGIADPPRVRVRICGSRRVATPKQAESSAAAVAGNGRAARSPGVRGRGTPRHAPIARTPGRRCGGNSRGSGTAQKAGARGSQAPAAAAHAGRSRAAKPARWATRKRKRTTTRPMHGDSAVLAPSLLRPLRSRCRRPTLLFP